MPWLYKEADQHKCAKPSFHPNAHVGDIWQCDGCRTCYVVRHEQHDGYYWQVAGSKDMDRVGLGLNQINQ